MARILVNEDKYCVAAAKTFYAISRSDPNQQTKADIVETSNALPKILKLREEADQKENNGTENDQGEKTQILCTALSSDGKVVAVGTSLKTMIIYNTSDLSVARAFRIPKAPTSVCFDQKNEYLVVGDRAGHVCRYTLAAPETNEGHKDITGEMCNFEGESLAGAISMVLDVAVSEKFMFVADRDEKVRIHRYPKAYVLDAFGLGHAHYVSSVDFAGDRLFSAGGDSTVREWEMATGRVVSVSDVIDKLPIKKIIALGQGSELRILAILDGGEALFVLKEEEGRFVVEKRVEVGSELLDVAANEGVAVGLTRTGLALFDLASSTVSPIAVSDEELKSSLETIKEPIKNYFKNVTHQNMEEYHKRKQDKMSKEKEKRQRKRRTGNGAEETEAKKAAV